MPYVTFRSYQISFLLLLLLAAGILGPAIALTYMWATRTATYVVEEPLSITSFPSAVSTHPGENQTLEITIENNADSYYMVTLTFIVDDTGYQQTYMNFSHISYRIDPGSNSITAWCTTAKKAPPAQLNLTIEFYRE
jgi:hypothetical protein